MRLTVDRQRLLESMQVVTSIIPARTIKPILMNVHLVADSDGPLALMATDLEISLRYLVPVESTRVAGSVLVNAGRLTAILKELDVEQVELDDEDVGKVCLRAGRSVFHLLSEDPVEYPEIPLFVEDRAFGFNRDKFVSLIRKTLFAVAKEKSRYGFNGAKLHIEGQEARMIATDGKRLAMKTELIDNTENISVGHLIPSRALTIFEKLLHNDDDHVRVALDDHQIMIKTKSAELTSRLVEGSFPNYQAVIPKDCSVNVRFNRQELLMAFRQAALLTSQETRSVKMHLAEGKATLRAQALDAGEAVIEIDAPDFHGEEMTVAFNPDFVHEGLRTIDAETVTMAMSRSTQPAKFLGEENFVYVVMPVTLRSA